MSTRLRTFAPALFAAIAAASCSSNSDTTFDDLRRQASERQAGYPAPPAPVDRSTWSTLAPEGGPSLNSSTSGGGPVTGMPDGGHPGDAAGDVIGVTDGGGDPASALGSRVSFTPSSSGTVIPSGIDQNVSLDDKTGTLVITPGEYATITVGYSPLQNNIDALGVQFGDSGSIRRIPLSSISGGEISLQVFVGSSVCDGLGPGCYDLTTNVYALTGSPEQASPPVPIDTVLICGDCQANGCANLNPSCSSVSPPADVQCGTQQSDSTASGDSTMTVELGSNTGTVTMQYGVTPGSSAQFQVRLGGQVVANVPCATSTGTTSFSAQPGVSTQVSVTVTPNCSGSEPGNWGFQVGCPVIN